MGQRSTRDEGMHRAKHDIASAQFCDSAHPCMSLSCGHKPARLLHVLFVFSFAVDSGQPVVKQPGRRRNGEKKMGIEGRGGEGRGGEEGGK